MPNHHFHDQVCHVSLANFQYCFDPHAYGDRVHANTGALACNLFPLYFNPDIDGILPSKGIKPLHGLNAGRGVDARKSGLPRKQLYQARHEKMVDHPLISIKVAH